MFVVCLCWPIWRVCLSICLDISGLCTSMQGHTIHFWGGVFTGWILLAWCCRREVIQSNITCRAVVLKVLSADPLGSGK
jgi:hypothetical protein